MFGPAQGRDASTTIRRYDSGQEASWISPQGLIQSDVETPAALKAKRLQASSLNPSSDCRCAHPSAPRCLLNREQNPVIFGSLAVGIDIAGSGPTLDATASQHPVL
jgi:hypothetical protein